MASNDDKSPDSSANAHIISNLFITIFQLTSQFLYDTVSTMLVLAFGLRRHVPMSNTSYYASSRSSLLNIADKIISAELIWPLPLVVVGVLGIVDWLIVAAAVILLLLPWVARWYVYGTPARRSFVGGALGLLVLSALISMWATYNLAVSLPMLLTLLGSVGLFFAISNTFISPRRVAAGLVIVAGLVSLYFVGQYAYFDYHEEAGRLAELGRLTGSLLPDVVLFVPHPNAVAGFLEGTVLLSLVLTWRTRGGEQFGWGLITLLIVYAMLITGSRGSWIGLLVALGVGGILLIPDRRFRLAVGGLGVIGGLLALFFIIWSGPRIHQMPFVNSTLATANSRLMLYRNSLDLLGDYLFTGIGLGDVFALTYSRYQLLISVPFLTYTHNLFLAIGLGLGILGLISLIWLLISFYYFVIRAERAGLSRRSLPLFRAAWLGVTVTFVHGLTDAPQFSEPGWTMPMLFAVLGLTIATGRPALLSNSKTNETVTEKETRWKWLALAIIAVFLIGTTVIFWRPIASAGYANLGAVYQTQADLSIDLSDDAREVAAQRAIIYFERALSLNPSQAVANRRFGIMALEREVFDVAVVYLKRAFDQEPGNQATLKALGYAYLWTGQLDVAEKLLRQRDDRDELREELGTWSWWWGTQERYDLSEYANEMVERLR
jgi:hypothetical protein